jgi:SAM-dependent methyltransferase
LEKYESILAILLREKILSINFLVMKKEYDYMNKNKDLWNKRTDYHFKSAFYNMDGFLKGDSSLNEIELNLLGDINGKTILHLQCHFGQDTLSLQRMGAQPTGIDFSDNAIKKAKELGLRLGLDTRFICCNIYDLHEHLTETFDIIFTSYGTIGWLNDLHKWGKLISDYLKPGGSFILVEFHPVIWMFDSEFKKIEYSYFKKDPIIELEANTYADEKAAINLESITWNHSISEVFQALKKYGLQVDDLQEYDYSPYNCVKNMEELAPKKYVIKDFGNKIPMVYSLVATKK